MFFSGLSLGGFVSLS